MRLLVIDGNSIANRAFYGIKLLTTKDGRYTNAIFGFLNILFKLLDEEKPEGLAVAFVSKLGLGTPETAIPPFNTKLITNDELDKNVLVAAVNGATLKKLGLYEGNRVVLTGKAGKVMAKIRVFEGVTDDTVALTMGFGHTAFGEFNDGKGMDVMALVTPSFEPGSGLSVWNDTRVNVAQA